MLFHALGLTRSSHDTHRVKTVVIETIKGKYFFDNGKEGVTSGLLILNACETFHCFFSLWTVYCIYCMMSRWENSEIPCNSVQMYIIKAYRGACGWHFLQNQGFAKNSSWLKGKQPFYNILVTNFFPSGSLRGVVMLYL